MNDISSTISQKGKSQNGFYKKTKHQWSKTLKQFVGCCRRIVWVCLTMGALFSCNTRFEIRPFTLLTMIYNLQFLLHEGWQIFLTLQHFAFVWNVPGLQTNQPPKVFYKKGVLKNFSKFTWKHLCRSLFFNKVTGSNKGVFPWI